MRNNGPLANKEVAMGGPVASGPATDMSIRPRLPKKLEPCGWMPFSGLPDGPFRGGIVQRQNRGL
jgi:hypothetical protein